MMKSEVPEAAYVELAPLRSVCSHMLCMRNSRLAYQVSPTLYPFAVRAYSVASPN